MIMKHRTTNRYKAKADGSLYVNEWISGFTLTYYYGDAGKLCTVFDNKWKTVLFL